MAGKIKQHAGDLVIRSGQVGPCDNIGAVVACGQMVGGSIAGVVRQRIDRRPLCAAVLQTVRMERDKQIAFGLMRNGDAGFKRDEMIRVARHHHIDPIAD